MNEQALIEEVKRRGYRTWCPPIQPHRILERRRERFQPLGLLGISIEGQNRSKLRHESVHAIANRLRTGYNGCDQKRGCYQHGLHPPPVQGGTPSEWDPIVSESALTCTRRRCDSAVSARLSLARGIRVGRSPDRRCRAASST